VDETVAPGRKVGSSYTQKYESISIFRGVMKVGERGQITIPQPLREQFGFSQGTEVEFVVQEGALLLVKKIHSRQWKSSTDVNASSVQPTS
jgi:AbrB family looped-hinge helix DNA binding protein